MDDLLEIVIELLFNRLGAFILGVLLIVAGVYVWLNYRGEAKHFDAAMGPDGVTAKATVIWKNQERVQSSSSDSETLTDYFKLQYTVNGQDVDVKVYVDPDIYAKYKEGDTFDIRYHPPNTEYIVTSWMKRPSTFWASMGTIALIVFGGIIILAVIVSLF